MAMRKTNELLEHSLTDIHADSLENRISVNDLAAAAQRQKSLGTSATYSSQLEDHQQKDKNK